MTILLCPEPLQLLTIIRAMVDIVSLVDYSPIPLLRSVREAEVGATAGRPIARIAGVLSHSHALLGQTITRLR